MKRILQIICIIGITLLAIFLENVFNLYDYIPNIPADKASDYGLTTYMTILELLREWIFEFVEKKMLDNKNVIECAFTKKGDAVDLSHNPLVELKDGNSVKNIVISIKMVGKKEKLKGGKIQVRFPDWVDIQNSNQLSKASVNGRKWSVNLNDILNECNENINIERKYVIAVVKNISEDGLNDVVEFEYPDRRRLDKKIYRCNKLSIKNIQ